MSRAYIDVYVDDALHGNQMLLVTVKGGNVIKSFDSQIDLEIWVDEINSKETTKRQYRYVDSTCKNCGFRYHKQYLKNGICDDCIEGILYC